MNDQIVLNLSLDNLYTVMEAIWVYFPKDVSKEIIKILNKSLNKEDSRKFFEYFLEEQCYK